MRTPDRGESAEDSAQNPPSSPASQSTVTPSATLMRTAAERADLERVSALLGVEQETLDTLLSKSTPTDPSAIVGDGSEFNGAAVCFTGTSTCKIGGKRITRESAARIATNAGLRVMKSVTKDLDLLVVADPDTKSGKAEKARDKGVRIVAERSFWTRIGVDCRLVRSAPT